MAEQPIVSFQDVCMYFGGVKAIDEISFDVEKGKIFGIIGPNGAGKSTLFNVLTGVYIPTKGQVLYKGNSVNHLMPHTITGGGISRTFQNIKLFDSETVLDNLKVAHYSHIGYGVADALFHTPKFKKEEARIEQESMEILKYLNLDRYADQKAGSLPYGEQRRIEIARALCCKPDVLLLDEPAHEPHRGGQPEPADLKHPGPLPAHHHGGGAPDAAGHEYLRRDPGGQFRPEADPGPAGGGPERPAGSGGVLRKGEISYERTREKGKSHLKGQ